jgi:polyketide biosynthesis enoyl-CoA hydratase PksI
MQLGFTPGMGATHAMLQAFGEPLGRELLLTGRLLTGREIAATRCPLAHAVVPRGMVLERSLTIAREIADAPRAALVLMARMLADARRGTLEAALRSEARAQAQLFSDTQTRREIEQRYPTRPPVRNPA